MNVLIFKYSDEWHDCAQFVNLLAGYYGQRYNLEIQLIKDEAPKHARPSYKIICEDFMLFSALDILCSFIIIVHRFHLHVERPVKKFVA